MEKIILQARQGREVLSVSSSITGFVNYHEKSCLAEKQDSFEKNEEDLNVDISCQKSMVFDKCPSGFDIVAHQGREYLVGGNSIFDLHF